MLTEQKFPFCFSAEGPTDMFFVFANAAARARRTHAAARKQQVAEKLPYKIFNKRGNAEKHCRSSGKHKNGR